MENESKQIFNANIQQQQQQQQQKHTKHIAQNEKYKIRYFWERENSTTHIFTNLFLMRANEIVVVVHFNEFVFFLEHTKSWSKKKLMPTFVFWLLLLLCR